MLFYIKICQESIIIALSISIISAYLAIYSRKLLVWVRFCYILSDKPQTNTSIIIIFFQKRSQFTDSCCLFKDAFCNISLFRGPLFFLKDINIHLNIEQYCSRSQSFSSNKCSVFKHTFTVSPAQLSFHSIQQLFLPWEGTNKENHI